jgi:hypothetical protein
MEDIILSTEEKMMLSIEALENSLLNSTQTRSIKRFNR